jgi:hypothetical protein
MVRMESAEFGKAGRDFSSHAPGQEAASPGYTHTEVVFGLYGSSDGLRSFFVSGSDMKGQG